MKENFWGDQAEATEINKEISEIKDDVEKIDFLNKELKEIDELIELEGDGLNQEINQKIELIEKEIEKEEIKTYFSGKYDKRNSVLQIFSGAGGQDAQDWVAMLCRMYEKYLEKEGFKINIIEQSLGESGGPEGRIGVKEVSLEVKGNYAFGTLKGEQGVHRLVRQSPFSSKQIRHTSFALVDVLPEINYKDDNFELKNDEVEFSTYKSSGPGGQNVNKRETAVRVVHRLTGLSASSQTSRLQGENREKAMKILAAKVQRYNEEKEKKKIKEIKGGNVSVEWGNQIRSYVLHPYKMVKDNRTGIETSKVEEVLEGDLNQFIQAQIKNKKQ
jgi:peptide chain release factor 2